MGTTDTTRESDASEDGRSTRAAAMRLARRRAVLESALRVFADKGYHQTRVSDILDEAEIARGTFYLYFESKNSIFHELIDELLADLRASVVGVELGDGAPTLREQIRSSIHRVVVGFHSRPELTAMLLREAIGLDPEVDGKLEAFYGRIHSWLAEALLNGRRLGLLRSVDEDIVAWCVIGSLKELVRRTFEARADADALWRASGEFVDLHMGGLVVPG